MIIFISFFIYLGINGIFDFVLIGIRPFPYNFMKVDDPSYFAWYTALLVANFLFYLIWYGFSLFKLRLYRRSRISAVGMNGPLSITNPAFQLADSMVLIKWSGGSDKHGVTSLTPFVDRDSSISC